MNKAEPQILSRLTFRRALAWMLIGIGSCALITNLGGAPTTQAASPALMKKDEAGSLRMVNVTAAVSLTRGQTFRLNFFNAGGRPLEIGPCFLDADGRHLRTTETLVRILPGQTFSYDLEYAAAGPPAVEAGPPAAGPPDRTVRGAIHADMAALDQLVVSGEVFNDATGKTDLFVPGVSTQRIGGNAPGGTGSGEQAARKAGGKDPSVGADEVTQSLAPVGITYGQKLRINLLNAGSRPMEVEPCFLDADGEHIVEMRGPITLAPGQTRWIEISRSEISSRGGLRVLLRGAVHVSRGDSPYLIAAGVIVHELTGEGSLYVPPAAPIGGEVLAGPPDRN
jgi:hypothetical protein